LKINYKKSLEKKNLQNPSNSSWTTFFFNVS